jgi:hypothetical protein
LVLSFDNTRFKLSRTDERVQEAIDPPMLDWIGKLIDPQIPSDRCRRAPIGILFKTVGRCSMLSHTVTAFGCGLRWVVIGSSFPAIPW